LETNNWILKLKRVPVRGKMYSFMWNHFQDKIENVDGFFKQHYFTFNELMDMRHDDRSDPPANLMRRVHDDFTCGLQFGGGLPDWLLNFRHIPSIRYLDDKTARYVVGTDHLQAWRDLFSNEDRENRLIYMSILEQLAEDAGLKLPTLLLESRNGTDAPSKLTITDIEATHLFLGYGGHIRWEIIGDFIKNNNLKLNPKWWDSGGQPKDVTPHYIHFSDTIVLANTLNKERFIKLSKELIDTRSCTESDWQNYMEYAAKRKIARSRDRPYGQDHKRTYHGLKRKDGKPNKKVRESWRRNLTRHKKKPEED